MDAENKKEELEKELEKEAMTDDEEEVSEKEAGEESVAEKEGTNETNSTSRRLVIIEISLAAAAILIIVLAIVIKQRNDRLDISSASANAAASNSSAEEVSSDEEIVIDNSALYTDTPAIPAFEADTSIDYEKLVEDGLMLNLSSSQVPVVYVHNYENKDYFLEETSVSDEEISTSLTKNYLINYLIETEATGDSARLYDSVSINYAGKVDGVAFDGGTADNVELVIGVSAYIDGFTEGIIGMKVGETKDVAVIFPENYGSAELAGKDAIFTITLNEILHANELPELTDALASEVSGGEFTSADELKDFVRKQLRYSLIWNFLDSDFYISTVPEDMIMEFYEQTLKQLDEETTNYQISAEYWISMYYGTDLAGFKQNLMQQAADTVWRDMVYQAIAEKEGFSVTDDDIAKLAEDYGAGDDVESFISSYGEITIRDYLLQNKLMDYMLELYK